MPFSSLDPAGIDAQLRDYNRRYVEHFHLLSKSNMPPDCARDTSTNPSTDRKTPMIHLPDSPANLVQGPVVLRPCLPTKLLFSEHNT